MQTEILSDLVSQLYPLISEKKTCETNVVDIRISIFFVVKSGDRT